MDANREREVARGLRAGREDAWHALYEAYSERVWRSAARLLPADAADVADVVQETFLAAARYSRGYDPDKGPLWAWLWGIARRQVALHYRVRQRHDRLRHVCEALASDGPLARWLEGHGDEPPELLESAELSELVRATLTELPAEYESLLTAKYLDGEAVESIAARERSTGVAVRSKLARARQAFREAFARHAGALPAGPARSPTHAPDGR